MPISAPIYYCLLDVAVHMAREQEYYARVRLAFARERDRLLELETTRLTRERDILIKERDMLYQEMSDKFSVM